MKRYPNAADGVSKLFLAEILGIIGAVASLIVVFFAATTVTSTIGGYVDGALGSLGLMAMLGAIVSILGIARLILSMIGLNTASRDCESFKTALYIVNVGLVCLIIGGMMDNGIIKTILEVISSIVNVVVLLLVVQGVSTLLPESELVEKGKRIYSIAMVAVLVSIVCSFLGGIPLIGFILKLAGSVCNIIYYVLYISFLSRAKAEL